MVGNQQGRSQVVYSIYRITVVMVALDIHLDWLTTPRPYLGAVGVTLTVLMPRLGVGVEPYHVDTLASRRGCHRSALNHGAVLSTTLMGKVMKPLIEVNQSDVMTSMTIMP